jgi:prepilin peptidase CpaA
LVKLSDLIVIGTLVVSSGAAIVIDLRSRRIPNVLTGAIVVAGLVLAASGVGRVGIGAAVLGILVGLALMLPGHLFGATGAGDVKLFAALGAVIGPAAIAVAFLYTAIAGGCLAIVVALCRRRLSETLGRTHRLIASGAAGASEIESVGAGNRFAYAPAIAIGVLVAAVMR